MWITQCVYITSTVWSHKLSPKQHLTGKAQAPKSSAPSEKMYLNVCFLGENILAGQVAFPAVPPINHLLNRVITVAATLC